MTQAFYAHMNNKKKIFFKRNLIILLTITCSAMILAFVCLLSNSRNEVPFDVYGTYDAKNNLDYPHFINAGLPLPYIQGQ
jgi:hypothetical protein